MNYRTIPGVIFILLVASGCSSPRRSSTVTSKNDRSASPKAVNKNPKFLDNISVTPETSNPGDTRVSKTAQKKPRDHTDFSRPSAIEKASPLQIKYALLLNTEVEEIRNLPLFKFIDDWYGTRYCLGGTTKNCIDCSAFVQLFFSAVYGVNIPRTARDQYDEADKVAINKLKEGDLLFFNTRGGVSHVGIYLQNNKFVHASTTGGVMISDMSETYYAKHFINAGHIDN